VVAERPEDFVVVRLLVWAKVVVAARINTKIISAVIRLKVILLSIRF